MIRFSIGAKGCMLDKCVCFIWLDMTIPPLWRAKSLYILIIIINFFFINSFNFNEIYDVEANLIF